MGVGGKAERKRQRKEEEKMALCQKINSINSRKTHTNTHMTHYLYI